MKFAAVRVGLAADVRPAHATSVVVFVTVRQDQEEVLPHRVCLLASRAEEVRRLELAETVYHVVIPASLPSWGALKWYLLIESTASARHLLLRVENRFGHGFPVPRKRPR